MFQRKGGSLVKASEAPVLWLNSGGLCSVHDKGVRMKPIPLKDCIHIQRALFLIHTKVLQRTMEAQWQFTVCAFNDEKACGVVGLNSNVSLRKVGTSSLDTGLVAMSEVLMDPDIAHSLYCAVRLMADQLRRIHLSYLSQKPRIHPDNSLSLPALYLIHYQFLKFLMFFLSLSPPTS